MNITIRHAKFEYEILKKLQKKDKMYKKWLDKNSRSLTTSNHDTINPDKRCSIHCSSELYFIYPESIKTASNSVEAALEILIRGKIAPHHTNSILHEMVIVLATPT